MLPSLRPEIPFTWEGCRTIGQVRAIRKYDLASAWGPPPESGVISRACVSFRHAGTSLILLHELFHPTTVYGRGEPGHGASVRKPLGARNFEIS
jgi:hypothetical protein